MKYEDVDDIDVSVVVDVDISDVDGGIDVDLMEE